MGFRRRSPRPPSSVLLSSLAVLPNEVSMLATATAALLALATTAQAATKYDSGHEAYKMRDYVHESYYAEEDYREPDHYSYGGDAYSEEPSREARPTPQSWRMHKRSTREEL